ncbi:hypothetical protein V8E55_007348 [Tylopilus felleus]
MILSLLLFYLVHLAQTVHGIDTNSTTSSSPQPSGDGTPCSIWSILGSCAVTLLICIWHAIHVDIDYTGGMFDGPVVLTFWAIFAPEKAHYMVTAFRGMSSSTLNIRRHTNLGTMSEKGYQWSMTHSFFAEMGGFVYRDHKGNSCTIDFLKFLELCEENKVLNPLIMSKSDALAKAILAVQLLWFTIQVVARGSRGLAVTLVELDTPNDVRADPQMQSALKNAWKPEPSYMAKLMAQFGCTRKIRKVTESNEIALIGTEFRENRMVLPLALSAAWLLLGVILRALLMGLMLASLRALPPSAYKTVVWTAYIPHL